MADTMMSYHNRVCRLLGSWLGASVLLSAGGCPSETLFQPLLVENLAATAAIFARQLAALFLVPLFP